MDRQISRTRSGFCSEQMTESAARVFSLLLSRVLESEPRFEVENRQRRWRMSDRILQRNAIDC